MQPVKLKVRPFQPTQYSCPDCGMTGTVIETLNKDLEVIKWVRTWT
jgi:hypothetical protein